MPGAVMTLLCIAALQGGLRAGIPVFLGSLLGEFMIVAGLLVLAILIGIPAWLFAAIGFAGFFVLAYMAWQVAHIESFNDPKNSKKQLVPWWKAMFLMLFNAPPYVFWTTVCFPLIWQFAEKIDDIWHASFLYFFAFEFGWAFSTFGTLLLFVFARQYLSNQKIMRFVFRFLALLLFMFALKMLWQSLVFFNIL